MAAAAAVHQAQAVSPPVERTPFLPLQAQQAALARSIRCVPRCLYSLKAAHAMLHYMVCYALVVRLFG
jgi:hypothetical protein